MFKQLSNFGKVSQRCCLTTFAGSCVSMRNTHTKIAVVGGGAGGATCVSQIIKSGMAHANEITVFDPSSLHWYQPSFTMISGGILGNNDSDISKVAGKLSHRPMKSIFSPNINLIEDSIVEYNPSSNEIFTNNGNKYSYDYLIICNGIKLRYDLVDGLLEALNNPQSSVGSMYKFDFAKKINKLRHKLKSGKAICTMPKMPIKCAGAPIKFLNLSEWSWRENGVRENIDLHYYTALPQMFGVKKYSDQLSIIANERNINTHFNHELVKVDSTNNVAYFRDLTIDVSNNENNDKSNGIVSTNFDFLHAPPPQTAHEHNAQSPLADSTGFIDVNKETLQSTKYENVFSIGDCCNAPTSKTAAAIYAQTPIMLHNMQLVMNGVRDSNELNAKYDGYTSCPIFIGNNKLLLAEFKYGGVPKETFPVDQAKPRSLFFYLKRYLFPYAYWNLGPRGMWYGTRSFFKPKWKSVEPTLKKSEENKSATKASAKM